jgi:hypothetical protein
MPRGRSFGRPGFGGTGYFGYGYPFAGRGNPYPFCRNFPWLPRGWWTGIYGPISPWNTYPSSGYGMPYGTPYPYGYTGYPYPGYRTY